MTVGDLPCRQNAPLDLKILSMRDRILAFLGQWAVVGAVGDHIFQEGSRDIQWATIYAPEDDF
jgi:hypothetical protein